MRRDTKTGDTKTEAGRITAEFIDKTEITAISGFHRRRFAACSEKEKDFIEPGTVIIKTTVICRTKSGESYKRNTINIVVTQSATGATEIKREQFLPIKRNSRQKAVPFSFSLANLSEKS
jgi:hypothetical protein